MIQALSPKKAGLAVLFWYTDSLKSNNRSQKIFSFGIKEASGSPEK